MFSGYVKRWAGEAVWWRKLCAEQEGEEKLGFSYAARKRSVFNLLKKREVIPFSCYLGNVACRYPAA
jgi:hypothetical protein